MRVAIVSDLHIHPWVEFNSLDNDRLKLCVNVLADVRSYCFEHDIKCTIIAGDLFHKRGVVNVEAYNLVVEQLNLFAVLGVTVLMVDGNHDHADKAGTVHTVQGLAKAGLVKEVQHVHGWENWNISDELAISGFSYCDSLQTFKERLDKANAEYHKAYRGHARIGIFHHGFKGARVGTVLEYQVKEEISPKLLVKGGFDYIFSGHYHGRQKIGTLQNAIYIGSPMEHMRGETKEQKGFIVYNSDTKKYKVVPLKRPKFITYAEDIVDDFMRGRATLECNGDYVDAYVYASGDERDVSRSIIKHCGARAVKTIPVAKRNERQQIEKRLNVNLSTDQRTILERYLDAKGVKKPKERKRLLELGQQLLEQAND